jgi:hypothetical protein
VAFEAQGHQLCVIIPQKDRLIIALVVNHFGVGIVATLALEAIPVKDSNADFLPGGTSKVHVVVPVYMPNPLPLEVRHDLLGFAG